MQNAVKTELAIYNVQITQEEQHECEVLRTSNFWPPLCMCVRSKQQRINEFTIFVLDVYLSLSR